MRRTALLWRGLAALAALLVAAWLALGLRAAILTERAVEEVTRGLQLGEQTSGDPRALAEAARDLDRATLLNPDRLPRSYYAQMILAVGERRRARELIEEVTREEPDNLEIWQTARAIALTLPDPRLEARARRRIRELTP